MIKSFSSSKRSLPSANHKGFSLVEVLVVIAIIGALAAVSFPIAGSIQHSSKLKKNKALVTSISNAIDRFHGEYGYLPATGQPAPADDMTLSGGELAELLDELEGKEDGLEFNIKGINFIEGVPAAKNGKNGIIREKGDIQNCLNAMGEEVFVTLDYSYDQEIQSPAKIEGREISGVKALVWTFGHGADASEDEILDDSAASWR